MKVSNVVGVALLAICSAKTVDIDKALREQEDEDEVEELAWQSKKARKSPKNGHSVGMAYDENGDIKVADDVDLKEHLSMLAQGESLKHGIGAGIDRSGGLKILEADIASEVCTEKVCCHEIADKYSRLLHSGGVTSIQHDIVTPSCQVTYIFTSEKAKLKKQVREFLQDQPEVFSINDEGKEYYSYHRPEPTEQEKAAHKQLKLPIKQEPTKKGKKRTKKSTKNAAGIKQARARKGDEL